jgi:RES domain-containing protein
MNKLGLLKRKSHKRRMLDLSDNKTVSGEPVDNENKSKNNWQNPSNEGKNSKLTVLRLRRRRNLK